MADKKDITTDSTAHPPSKERVMAVCCDCGKPVTAFLKADDDLQPVGSRDCPGCGGTNLRELTDDDIDTE